MRCFSLTALLLGCLSASALSAEELTRIEYRHPGLTVDLGVGLWAGPLPMDYDRDGDLDLVVSCPDTPSNGTYFFENPGGGKLPVFKPPVRIGPGHRNIRVSHVEGEPRVLVPAREFREFRSRQFDEPLALSLPAKIHPGKIRANQWHYLDYDGDGDQDVIIAIGDWNDYGWDDAYNADGEWTNGPLHGFVYLVENTSTSDEPRYAEPVKLLAGGTPIDVFGRPGPNFADFDGDGDLDLLCGEFLDRFTYFENVGTRTEPRYASGRRLEHDGRPLRMDLQMIVPSAIDWDADGDVDLICGDEDGRVALIEHTGTVTDGTVHDGLPHFLPPVYFQQEARHVKFGALATPFGFDWDGDGDDDILSGNTAGHIGFIENLGTDDKTGMPRWAAPVRLKADGKTIRIQAGTNGSIQGPAEAKWGYTTLTAADWNHDGLPDLVVNSIWGEVIWYRNVGTQTEPRLAAAAPIQVAWPNAPPKPEWVWWTPKQNQLVTQWRTTPVAIDWNGDALTDLIMLDHEGHLAFFERRKKSDQLVLSPGRRIFIDENGEPLRLNPDRAGKSGRRKLAIVDWDGDGRRDLLLNGRNADFYRNLAERDGHIVLKNTG
ncbi:MAG: VCBS repeat-containing protein, partial [Planctomycetaceae bacterium]